MCLTYISGILKATMQKLAVERVGGDFLDAERTTSLPGAADYSSKSLDTFSLTVGCQDDKQWAKKFSLFSGRVLDAILLIWHQFQTQGKGLKCICYIPSLS